MPGPLYTPRKPGENRDRFVIEVLPDGRIKILTDAFSAAVHTTAEKFLGDIAAKLGGEVKREQREDKPHHHHHEGEEHSHTHA